MDLGGSDTIHIAAQGFEEERVYEPIIKYDVDRAILLVHEEEVEQAKDCNQKIESKLEENGIQFENISTNFFDIYRSLQTYAEIISRHSTDELFINISTGSKLTAVSGMIACMSSSAQPYYARVEYDDRKITGSVIDTDPVNIYPIGLPDEAALGIMEVLAEQGEAVSKNKLLKTLEENGHALFEEHDRKSIESMYNPLNELLEPLEQRNLIRIIRAGGKANVCLTDEGEQAYETFQRLLQT